MQKNDDHLSVERQVKMARCVAAGMDYLSTVGFVHRVSQCKRQLAVYTVMATKNVIVQTHSCISIRVNFPSKSDKGYR